MPDFASPLFPYFFPFVPYVCSIFLPHIHTFHTCSTNIIYRMYWSSGKCTVLQKTFLIFKLTVLNSAKSFYQIYELFGKVGVYSPSARHLYFSAPYCCRIPSIFSYFRVISTLLLFMYPLLYSKFCLTFRFFSFFNLPRISISTFFPTFPHLCHTPEIFTYHY